MVNSTTGINFLLSKYKFAIIFNDNRCPFCGKYMNLDTISIGGHKINFRYLCRNCGLIFPIYHSENDIMPIYDSSIKSFIDNFGNDIRQR